MAIVNRDLDASQQREVYQCMVGQGASSLIATGTTAAIALVPFAAQLVAAQCVGFGVSGAPTVTFDITRQNSGGVTTITGIVSALTLSAAGVTPVVQSQGFTISSGSSLVSLQANDIVHMRTGASNTAMVAATVTLVVKALQDIKTHFSR